jgi:hypothetical protein
MKWKTWPHVHFSDRASLPSSSGIYAVTDWNGLVWYVGQAIDLRKRWIGRGHHRYPQLIRSHRKNDYKIYWLNVPVELLNAEESYYINLFKPELNGCKVKSYVPKQPLVEREIKRVLGVLNKKTTLFPVIRSLAIGGYLESDQTRCILIANNINDFRVLNNSSNKKYAPAVRQAWGEFVSFCGREDESGYHCPQILVYRIHKLRFEFLCLPELLNYFETNLDALEQHLCSTNLFGLEVASLKSLNVLCSMSLEEEYQHKHSPGKIQLYPGAYLKYRLNQLMCLTEFLEVSDELTLLEHHITEV